MPAEVIGAHFKARNGSLKYHAGLFSGNVEEEFGDLDHGSAAVAGIGHENNWFGLDGIVQVDYLYNGSSDDEDSNAFRRYRHILSLWYKAEKDRFGLGVDFTGAEDIDGSGTVWGFTVQPTWIMLERVFADDDPLQLVLRYQYAGSSNENGLQPQRRYEQEVTDANGDRYQAVYTGLNYYIYGNKLKLMLGGEFARMNDDPDEGGEYRGWTWFGAVRLYF
jgi:phosphate-selective porin OprO/OprP